MKETPKYVKEVQQILADINESNEKDTGGYGATPTPEHEFDVYIEEFEEEDRITLIRKKPYGIPATQDEEEIGLDDLDTAPLTKRETSQPVTNAFIGALLLGLLIPFFCIALQLYFIVNPYTVTVSLLAKSQQLTLTGTLNLGRVLNPITLSQSQTVPTTGHGHQDAKRAVGYITFLNGQFTQVTVPAGTTFTGNSGEQIITDQDAVIPAASPNPPSLGQVTVSAHAITPGSAGDIQALDINGTLSSSLFVKNLNAFTGGQDERDFKAVAKSDIDLTASQLKSTLIQGTQGVLQGELKQGEELQMLQCSPTVTPDHQIGQEAISVKVTATETCSGIAYNGDALQSKVTELLNSQAIKKLGESYSMLENPQISIIQATVNSTPPTVSLSFKAQSAWVYALTGAEQKHIKELIAGKSKDEALSLLASLPGIESVSMASTGFGDNAVIPKHIENIRLAIIYV